jgi:hypothetical protein
MTIPGYDAWKLSSPDDDQPGPIIGNEDGETCNRVHEPDEDAPRGYRPKPCKGVMFLAGNETDDCWVQCDTCGEIGD